MEMWSLPWLHCRIRHYSNLKALQYSKLFISHFQATVSSQPLPRVGLPRTVGVRGANHGSCSQYGGSHTLKCSLWAVITCVWYSVGLAPVLWLCFLLLLCPLFGSCQSLFLLSPVFLLFLWPRGELPCPCFFSQLTCNRQRVALGRHAGGCYADSYHE